ncbi:hypothetical protein ACFFQW_06625 [Umezawaea endophytica]|uniref:Uncharacterized protein n=1 Tax=Umezawaea endophytica TaxID=1654476 RepID=A0A9X2VQI7_9PSEU|nr:hypothetical protein [Umezawaea endophytica]MCS7480996.1 hypothetical protein [Umezawaea endophytica]
MTTPEDPVARLARVDDTDLAGAGSTAAARSLLTAIVAEPVVPRRSRTLRLVAAAGLTVALAAGAVLLGGPGGATSYASSAIEVRLEGGYFVARIKDPLAESAEFAKAFRAVGLDADITLVPVSPRLVGVMIEGWGGGRGTVRSSSDVEAPPGVDCAVRPADCTLVLRISEDSTGAVRYKIGRVAEPGEPLQDPDTSSTEPTSTGNASSGGTG